MELIERHEQIAVLEDLAEQCITGQGQVALLCGAPATGRTALLQSFARSQLERGALVLSASCAPAEEGLFLGVVSQLLYATPLPDPHGTEIGRLLEGAAAQGGTADADRQRLYHALCLRLRAVAADRPLLITVDDIGHADPASLDFLQQLVRRSSADRIMVTVTDNGERPDVTAPLLAELQRQQHMRHIQVAPLSRRGAYELVARRFGPESAEPLAAELHAASGGNPLLLSALIDDRAAQTQDNSRYELAVLGLLQDRDPVVLEVARGIAVLDDEETGLDTARLLDLNPQAVDCALRKLTSAGLLLNRRFRQESARAAVLERIPEKVRATLHRRAAELLIESGSAPTAVAFHLLSAGTAPPVWGMPCLLEAAEQELYSLRLVRGAQYLELALAGPTEPGAAASIRARLTHTEWMINPVSAGRHLPALTNALRAGHLSLREGLNLIRHLLWHGRTQEAGRLLSLVRDGAANSPAVADELRDLEGWLAFTHPPLARRGYLPPVRPDDGRTVTPLADPWLQAAAVMAGQLSRGQTEEAVVRAKETLRDLHLGRHTCWVDEAALLAFRTLLVADRTHTAQEWCERLLDREAGGRTLPWRALMLFVRAEVAMARGDLAGAARHAEESLTELNVRAWGVAAGLPLGTLILANARLGRFEEAGALLAHQVPDTMFQTSHGVHYLYARGQLHLATRHYHAALADFLSCGDLVRGWGLDPAGLVQWRTGAAEAWLGLGNTEQMRQQVGNQLTWQGSGSARGRALALRLTASAGPVGRRPQLLLESLELLEKCGDRFEQARTLAKLSSAYHLLDENRRARMVFRRSMHLAQSCNAESLTRELLSVSSELGEAPAASGDAEKLAVLTGSERRVAALAAMGYTNREIATKLYITASTVEQHLTRVYRKLEITHRKELPSDLNWLRDKTG
ncbi:LuxR family transcriptional regulator [Streptomyces sp. NBC_00102]|uniref:helix-turn-helix transcriptional regulator n=1 Tax=Streptomyces sp. NBC_00102 TaxID=2975652 RepID=UPI00224FBD48|nr:LuxR family transcriptional regulator [Streptomyces sp. NBC_00102]MCX5399871.1 AAA family ATPase [Streptomyces sp. NBC_00102]